MSYEVINEWLCKSGHYLVTDAYDNDPSECDKCGAPMAFAHSIDQTNGYEEDNPDTYPALKTLLGSTDIWHTDHYGTRYATERQRYAPKDDTWRKV